jgi:hypothetical protein
VEVCGSETYLLGHQKCLRRGRDIVALDYEAKNMALGWIRGCSLGRSLAGTLVGVGIKVGVGRRGLSHRESDVERG